MTELEAIQLQTPFKILLIGDDCLDIYQFGTVDRISPEAPVPVFKYSHKEERPGMARNVKVNLENLGCDVTYISEATSVKTRLIDIRSKQHIVRIDNDNRSQPTTVNHLNFNSFHAVVISDYNKGTLTESMIIDIVRMAGAEKIPIFIDTKKTNLELFQGAWVKINESESRLITSECSGLIITQGPKGASIPHHNIQCPAPSVEVADVCGAGDTFLSAFAVQYLYTKDLEKSIMFANTAASITVQHLGCYAPSYDEIRNAGY